MRFTNLQAGAGRLREATDDFHVVWQASIEHWNDQKQAEMQQHLVDHMQSEVQNAMHVINQASQMLQMAVRQLEEH